MKLWLPLCLLMLSVGVRAQTIYENFEVDKPGEPQGGVAMLQVFLRNNLKVPVKAQAARVTGRVFLGGIVEPDGKISSVTVLRGLRPDCDREAVRVFELFNAWVPAVKDGQKVRQRINYPITFAPSPATYFSDGNQIIYFTKEGQLIADTASTVFYKQITPVDTLSGLPIGNRIIYERKGEKWQEIAQFRLSRTPTEPREKDPAKQRTQLVFFDQQLQRSQTMYTLYPNGSVYMQATYENGRPVGDKQVYAPNGMLEVSEEIDETPLGVVELKGRSTAQRVVATSTRQTTWYRNGQVKSVEVQSAPVRGQPTVPGKLMSLWDSTGVALVTDGNGRGVYTSEVQSRLDNTKTVLFVESGQVRDGWKEGVWTGSYADGSYKYEETYEGGICQNGKSEVAGKVYPYTGIEQIPEPTGGMQALGQYLSGALRYPADAQRSRIQGRVFVSFVVNTDGSISDVSVLKGIGFGCDEEAARVVRQMPRWRPGIQRGQPVRTKFNLPIGFTLQ